MSHVIRILCVVRHPVGGIRTYLKYTYRSLPPGKYEFTIVAASSPETAHLVRDLADAAVRVIEVSDDRPNLSLLRGVIRALRSTRFDLIHSQGFTAGVIAAIGNLLFRLPHVITSHDVLRDEQFTGLGGALKARLLGQILRRADIVQSVSCDAQENLIAYVPGITRTSLAVIRNGIDVDRFPVADPLRLSPASAAGGPFVFGFLGRLMPQKGFEYLVDAVQMLDDDPAHRDRFVVRVVSDGGFIREHRAAIESRGLARYFDFAGFMPDISPALAAFDTVVMPSLWEACGLVAMEAMVAGCPLIAARCIGLREVIDDTPAAGVPPADAAALADAMRHAMQHGADARRAALDFAPTARERFDARRASEALDALFDRALPAGRQAPFAAPRARVAEQ
jgi:glycosyltransferase involved in cell wall biosynthesis